MKALQDTPTAELLAEWNKKESPILIPNAELEQWLNEKTARRNAIAAELDRRCSEAGIQMHVDGMVSFSKFGDKTDDMVCPRIYAADLRDLLTWLLMKGGNG